MNTKMIGIIVLTGSLSACAGMTHSERDTAIGAGAGAVIGGVATGGSTLGIVGGAAVGGIIGNEVGQSHERDRYRR